MHRFAADLRYALRQLRRSPSTAFLALLTLTLGVAANVIVFGVIDALFMRPLPGVVESGRLFTVQHPEDWWITLSYPDYCDLRDRNTVFSSVAMFRIARIGMGRTAGARPVWGYEASGNYFDTLGVKPALGRFFGPADDVDPGGKQYAVVSYSYWQEQLGGSPDVIGMTIYLNKYPYTLLGVTPKGFRGTERLLWPDVWVPITNQMQIEGYDWIHSRSNENSWVIARLKPAVTVAQAEANLNSIARELAREYPGSDEKLHLALSKPGFLGNALGVPARSFTLAIMLLALLVLLAACANLGGLFAARTADRSRELAVRMAVGSSRLRILQQLVTESISIALIGGVAALFLARAVLHLLSRWHPPTEFPIQLAVDADPVVYGFALIAAVATGVLLGVLPARQVWNTDPNHALRGSGSSPLVWHHWATRDVLLVIQIALCCLLITASFVSLRGLLRTFQTPLGFDPQNVILATFDLHLAHYADDDAARAQQQLLQRVAHLPGVSAAAYASSTPLSLDQSETDIYPADATVFLPSTMKFMANYYSISPGYLPTAGTRLLRGRDFTWHEDQHAPKVAIVNQTFARQLFADSDAIGKYFRVGADHKYQVVGVVEDGKYVYLAEEPTPAMFVPILQKNNTSTVLMVRTAAAPGEVLPELRQAISDFDTTIPLYGLSSWPNALSMALFPARTATVALSIFGVLALLLAVTGVFGLASYTVSKRRRELGIRVALGARSQEVLRTALGRTALLVAAGSCAGLLLGIAASRLLAMIVYGANALDPAVLLGALGTMALVGLGSSLLPARRALAENPARLLREE